MKYLLVAVLFCASVCFGNMKIAFVADKSYLQANSAILNGIKNVSKELSVSRGEQIDVVFWELDNSKKQSDMLSNLYMNGFSGAVLLPVDNNAELSSKISELKKAHFPVVVLDNKVNFSDALCSIYTNQDMRIALIENVINKRSSKNTKIACYFKGAIPKSVPINDDVQIKNLLQYSSDFYLFTSILKSRILSIDVVDFYSSYADTNKVEIMRRDSYGEIFFSPNVLLNMQPITPDTDRAFALCVGALPMLEFYFATSAITDCIYDDYYGWGVFAVRAIVDYKNNVKISSQTTLRPIYVTKENYKIFSSDWQKWLR